MVDGMQKEFPDTNVVVCHTDHEADFDGEEDVDWAHTHFEIDISLGGTIGYEVYVGGSGTFKRNGDGGYMNWGWYGFPLVHSVGVDSNVSRRAGVLAKDAEEDGSLLTFASR
ncbi:hypothetical protein AURDEDRAFT_136092 [Auricularia subglabra TFB-10046 SS5]|nr:hypothetical protein AURDEDRAFT_136092 [Auricularia subglabra TFB-10046 SS5]